MRIVLDTNVLVSGLLNPFGAPGEIVRLISSSDITLAYDPRILAEYQEVLSRRKFDFDIELVNALLEQIQAKGELVVAKPIKKRLPDPDDECFLEVAISSFTKNLVTGNLNHYSPANREGVEVTSPAEFLNKFRKKLQDAF